MARTNNLADQRLRDIEVLLLWEGQVGNARLRDIYGIGLGAASILIKAYREAFPDACLWNSVERVFEAVPESLSARLSEGRVSDYAELLARTRSSNESVTYDAHVDLTSVTAGVFSNLHRACSRGLCVEITYASMTTPEPQTRLLFPKQMVQAGRRWHVRGFDLRTNQFRDFTLGRIISVADVNEPWPDNAPSDHAWETTVEFHLVPHPALSQAQAKVIRREYMNGAAARVVRCRGAMVSYVLQELRVAVNPLVETPPSFQLALVDDKPVRPWLFSNA